MGSTGELVTSVTYSVMTPDLEEQVRRIARDEIQRELARRVAEQAPPKEAA